MAIDLDSYLERYAPPPDTSNDWKRQLMVLGLGLMGAKKGDEFGQFGRSGLLAMDAGEQMAKTRREEHRQRVSDVASMWKLAKDEEDRGRRANLQQLLMARVGGGAGTPAAGPGGSGGGFMPASMPAPNGGPISPGSGPSLPPPTGTPAQPGPFPGAGAGGPPGVDPLALALSMEPGLGDTAKLLQGATDKAAEWSAIKIGPNGTIYNNGGVVGQIAPEGRGYVLGGKFHPGNPDLIAAVRAGDVEKAQRELQNAIDLEDAKAKRRPFQIPGTNTVTSEYAATGGGVAGPSPGMVVAEQEAAKSGAKQEAEFRDAANQAAALADSVQTLRMVDPGSDYSGGASDFRMAMDNLFSVIPGLKEFVDKNKLGTAQSFQANYQRIILEVVSPMLKGQTSDRDVRIMLSAGPGLFMQPAGRQVLYDILENRAERAQRIAAAASEHMAKNGNMRGFDPRKAGGEIKGVLSVPARDKLGAAEQAEMRKIIDAAAKGDADARAALKIAVQKGWVLY